MQSLEDQLKQLSPEDQVKLTSGTNFWQSVAIPEYQIPSFRMSDGPNGLRYQAGEGDALGINDSVISTCFPTASAVACTWDPDLVVEMGRAIGLEARSLNVDMVLGPGINIKRNPLCGRNFEYFSEDPYLAGMIGAGWIRGLQSEGAAACLKHFAGNNQENDRLLSDSLIDPTALHEVYLEAFRIAVQTAQPEGVMCSYNKVNGTYSSDNAYLLTDMLRRQWGFKGTVVTDWGALNNKVASLNAGGDLEMPSSHNMFDQQALTALKDGQLKPAALYRAAENVLRVAEKSRPKFNGDRQTLLEQNGKLAQRIEENAAVLLKNDDHILPIQLAQKVLVVGQMATETRYQGAGSSHINPPAQTSILQGLSHAGIVYDYQQGYAFSNKEADQLAGAAVKAAKNAQTVVVVAGLPESAESEGFDRPTMALPANQNALIDQLAAVNSNLIVLLVAGAPVELPWQSRVKGLINLYLGGQFVGDAAANLLVGKVNPSGKLAESYPISYQDVPSADSYDKNPRSVAYAESVYVGYRYYEKANQPVAFPFGFGLSYTTFKLSGLALDQHQIQAGQSIEAKVTLENTGDRDGAEVVEVYIGNSPNRALKPLKELKGFQKVFLRAGETKTVTVELTARAFSEWDDQQQEWQLPAVDKAVVVMIGSSRESLSAPVNVVGQALATTSVPTWYITPVGKPSLSDFTAMSGLRVQPPITSRPGQYTRLSTPRELSAHSAIIRKIATVLKNNQSKGITDPDSPEAKFMDAIIMDTPLIRLAQQSDGKLSLGLVDRLVALANRHYWQVIWGR
ncbi:glycoside hydrolase family 3 C-terminal domain-containing protein [Lentilactobacillus kisonensis]|uniref:Beta-glucosidase n=1 Tax=Lentilactobacillus kisonensis DSM 19906 = JCM 15041 TaxID=1423766 RepID=A0A0R1NS54_9LACO|nr:glycoside hydrolase family 3 C-terminal domain-containing protein [Lentilactobacillus kisonensis]KRL19371.1 beta-glucosidase [Lentilactobacillus kisonensis DSM 19906 = JCM 15041]